MEGTVASFGMRYGQVVKVPRPKAGLWAHDEPQGSGKKGGKKTRSMSAGRQKRRKPSKYPKVAELKLVRPPVMTDLSDDELRDEILARVDARELELIEQRRRSGKQVLGMKKVLAQHWAACPPKRKDLFTTVPNVSGRSKWARIEALQRRAEFLQAYARARDAFAAGDRDVAFPPGTWLMRRRYNVRCHPPPT